MSVDDKKNINAEIRKLEESFAVELEGSRRTSCASLVISIAGGVIVAVFLLVNYMNVRREWTGEKFGTSLRRELAELEPKALEALETLLEHLVPVFQAEGRRQLEAKKEMIGTRLQNELEEVAEDVLSRVHQKLTESQERVLANTEKTLFQSYLDLDNAARRAQLRNRFRASTEIALASAVSEFDRRFGDHVREVEKSLTDFDLADDHHKNVDLKKRFLRLWLQLLDREISDL